MKIYFKSLFIYMLGMSMGWMATTISAKAGNASSVFNFTTTFVGGSCDISTPVSVQFNKGDLFSSQEIEQKTAATTETFEIALSNCAGWGLTPSIKVRGHTSNLGEPLFHDVMGPIDAKGYGILLQTPGNGIFNPNLNLAENGEISASDWSSDNDLSMVVTTLPMVASLSCGDCNDSGRQGGEFKATVTFDFIYE